MIFGKRAREHESKLATKIRISYLLILLPNIIFMIYVFHGLWMTNERYKDMLNSVVAASEFSLDFKEDFDYETYLLIVGNVTWEDSNLPTLLQDARKVVDGLKDYTDTHDNQKRLASAEKYLNNLETYTDRIKENLEYGNKYEANITIWENDVQIVTGLLQETINEYIYYENRQLQVTQSRNRELFMKTLEISLVIFAAILTAIALISFWMPNWITKPIEDQVKEEQKQLRKAEFELLQAQINPHFLYNTLDAIVWSAEAGNQKQVVSMVGSLSEFFRASLNKGKEIVTIREELQHVTSYLEIQQVRYQDILTYEINVAKDIYDYCIPKITIQPIVENALYHGIKNRRGGGKITITGVENKDELTIQVHDDGAGMDEERLKEVREGIIKNNPDKTAIYGLYNVNERIRLNFGDEYGITVDSKLGKGTDVVIHLPKILTDSVKK
ncbi:sensor histidine kinase [Butyrivibrio sp. INlla14]|uniref:sensor histidine kinase n=1 Tax=Butyrivibrio sp. INlla14 TaxID=1520808 RepID=UPI00087647E4|nr:sensor histidine kinase [Butyrivibrio sp. INlla14]SCX97958.1 two-component system, sensor histidine kinase YesM [Butyrivibrio sp. INlla14]